MTLLISENVKNIMEERGIFEADVKEVVEFSETGEKLFDEESGISLGKKRLDNFTVYVEYKVDGAEIVVINTYSHRIELAEDR